MEQTIPGPATGMNISLYPRQRALLIQVAKEQGLETVSAAARYIIHDWVALKSAAIRAATVDGGGRDGRTGLITALIGTEEQAA